LSEEADADAVFIAIARGEGHPGRERNLPPDDAVAAIEVVLDVEEVHRATLALRIPRAAAEQLGHGHAGIRIAGEAMALLAVVAEHVGVGPERLHPPDGDRLLTYVEVAEAGDLPQAVLLARAFLEPANEEHPAVHGQQLVFGDGAGHGSS